jgi:hypothetical protein
MERLEEVPDGGGRRQRVPEELGQGAIFAQWGEILAPVPTAHPQGEQALHELRGLQPALALLHDHLGVDRRGDSHVPEQLDHEGHPGPAGDQRGIKRNIDLERQPWRVLGHRVPPGESCTHWVNGSKRDATRIGRLDGGFPRDLLHPSGR